MFDRFTDRARMTMGNSRQECLRFHHDHIAPEHILLGLIQVGGVAAEVLKNLDVDPTRIREEVEKLITRGTTIVTMGQIPFTPAAKKVLELALAEASSLGHGYIGAEHLLLGLIREEKGIAARALDKLGVRLEAARKEIRELAPVEVGRDATGDPSRAPERQRATHLGGYFDRFTDRARKVLGLAREVAQRLNHDYIGTEHILIGLIEEGSGVAADVLMNLDVDPKRIRQETERLVTHGTTPVTTGQLPFTQPGKRVLELALEEANNLGHNYIGTEHLLLGLIRQQEGIAAQVLQNLNVRLEDAREEVRELLGAEVEEAPAPPSREEEDEPGPLTPRARDVMWLASALAGHWKHEDIGTEHILLGLVAADGDGASVLRRLGVDPARVRAEVEKRVTPGSAPAASGQLPFTPALKRALELTLKEAERLGADSVREEHLLLGLVGEGTGIAAQALAALGVTLDALRRALGPPAPPG